MKANYEAPKQEAEISMGNMYEVNKQLMKYETPITEEEIINRKNDITNWLFETDNKYYMLLCHEKRDYTIFAVKNETGAEDIADILIDECIYNRGDLIAIDKVSNEEVYEIWIKDLSDEYNCYYFFPYGEAVIEV